MPAPIDGKRNGGRPLHVAWRSADSIALALVTGVGAALRFFRLDRPGSIVFDEFYAQDACWYLYRSSATCTLPQFGGVERFTAEITPMHPPLGKWLIALGVKFLGFNPLGWRLASVLAGIVTIALLYVLTRRLLQSLLAAAAAAGLLAIDFLHFVQSRVAMLDIFNALFGVAAFLFLVYDRDELLRRTAGAASTHGRARLWRRPWRIAAGAASGAAVASKWPGIFILFAVILLAVGWELRIRQGRGWTGAARRTWGEEGLSLALWLGVLPASIYVATYAGVLSGHVLTWPWSPDSWVAAFTERQLFMVRWHWRDLGEHPYQSPAWSWLLLKRPALYFFAMRDGLVREILALGSPLVWWSSILALGLTGVRWIRARRPVGAEEVILAGFVLTYGPWLLLASRRSHVFLYYLLPAVPFMCLAIAYAMSRIPPRRLRGLVVAGFMIPVTALFIFYYPVMTAVALPYDGWKTRMMFTRCRDQQTEPRGVPRVQPGPPPPGYCWI